MELSWFFTNEDALLLMKISLAISAIAIFLIVAALLQPLKGEKKQN
jgi:hypothetical protein